MNLYRVGMSGIRPSPSKSSRASSRVRSSGGTIPSDGRENLVRQAGAVRPHRLGHAPEQLRELLLVAGLERTLGLLVEVVEPLRNLVVHLELTLAEHPDDHGWSSFFSSPEPSSAFICASSWSTCDFDAIAPSSRSSWVWSEVKSSSAPEVVSSSIAAARGGHLVGLVLRALDREPGVGHLLADPRRGLADPHLSLGGGVLRLDRLLLRAEGLDLRRERLLAGDQLLLLGRELRRLLVEALELLLQAGLALQRLPGEILAALGDGLSRLGVELDDALLDLRLLELEPLLRSDDVGDAALHVLEQLELLLVRVVQGLARILGAIEQLRHFRLHDERCA